MLVRPLEQLVPEGGGVVILYYRLDYIIDWRVVVVVGVGGGGWRVGGGGYKTGVRLGGVAALVEKCSRQFTGDRRQIYT